MHYCDICKYYTEKASFLKKHLKSKKHILKTESNKNIEITENIEISNVIEPIKSIEPIEQTKIIENIFKCFFCDNQYVYKSGLSRHEKICNKKPIDIVILKENKQKDKEIKKLKKELISKLKKELKKELKKDMEEKDLKIKEKDLKIKELEKNNLQLIKNNNSNNNIINNIIINNNQNIINISKLDNLNLNFGNVIDITTFIDNFKDDKFGLTKNETQSLLDNYKKFGITCFAEKLFIYLKESAIKQYKEILEKDIDENDVVLPFLLSDKCVREHFEKNINGRWGRIIIYDNINKILDFIKILIHTNHSQSLLLDTVKRKKIMDLLLKKSGYSNLIDISIPELYKAITD